MSTKKNYAGRNSHNAIHSGWKKTLQVSSTAS